jgi:hypothetical protein
LYYREDIEGTTNVFIDIYFGNNEISIDERLNKKRVIQNSKNVPAFFKIKMFLEDSIYKVVPITNKKSIFMGNLNGNTNSFLLDLKTLLYYKCFMVIVQPTNTN